LHSVAFCPNASASGSRRRLIRELTGQWIQRRVALLTTMFRDWWAVPTLHSESQFKFI